MSILLILSGHITTKTQFKFEISAQNTEIVESAFFPHSISANWPGSQKFADHKEDGR